MDIKRVIEAVQIVRRGKKQVTWDAESAKEYNDALNLVLDTCETVIAVGAKMPVRLTPTIINGDKPIYQSEFEEGNIEGSNEMLDACTIAFAGMIPEEKRLVNKMPHIGYNDEITGWNACRDAILSAMKGGGE